mgnify:CR=1 FL=1
MLGTFESGLQSGSAALTRNRFGAVTLENTSHITLTGMHLRDTGCGLWPAPQSGEEAVILAHEFHYSSVENLGPDVRFADAAAYGAVAVKPRRRTR